MPYYVGIYTENFCHILLIHILRICDKQLNTAHRQKHIIHVILEDIHIIPHTGNLL